MPIATISVRKAAAMRPRTRSMPRPAHAGNGRGGKPASASPPPRPKKEGDAPTPPPAPGAFNNDVYLLNKQMKEKYLAERAQVAGEREKLELAARQGELVTLDDAQKMLEKEHAIWLNMVEEWRQTISKKLSKLGIPVEMQESIAEMILRETTIMRQKRAVAE